MTLDDEFVAAVTAVNAAKADPGNDTKLRLYALYKVTMAGRLRADKQATADDVSGKRPGFLDPVGRAKYDAWASVAGMDTETARTGYVEAAQALR